MNQVAAENVLVIGDIDQQVHSALKQAVPEVRVTEVGSYFEGVAALIANRYKTVLASAEPIERRPEAAVNTLRQLTSDGRLVLFAHPTLEPLARKMLSFGADDYIITPVSAGELGQIVGAPPLRLAPESDEVEPVPLSVSPPSKLALLGGLPLAEIMLESVLANPQGGCEAAARLITQRVGPMMQIHYLRPGAASPQVPEGLAELTQPVRVDTKEVARLQLFIPRDEDEAASRHFIAQLAHLFSKLAAMEQRNVRLHRMAITDDLTGLYNRRWFYIFLGQIIEKARVMRFPVTLLLYDIDGFKAYNDVHGHGAGDEVLRETAALMKRCVRDHDLVARLGGDEFGVIFWEKEGPRQPRDPSAAGSSRVPQTPMQIFRRFQKLISATEFRARGPLADATLTISGAMAVYPFDASSAEALVEVADKELVLGAKKSGKNCLRIVGGEPQTDDAPEQT